MNELICCVLRGFFLLLLFCNAKRKPKTKSSNNNWKKKILEDYPIFKQPIKNIPWLMQGESNLFTSQIKPISVIFWSDFMLQRNGS